jgi:hypothetical protein
MIEESITETLSNMDGKYKFNDLLTFMEVSGINFINRRLAGPLAIATLDGVIVDVKNIKNYPEKVVYFIFIHEIAHMKRINKFGKDWLLSQLSIEEEELFLSEICKEEVLADRYACRMFYKLNNLIFPWTSTQQLNLPEKQKAYAPLVIHGYYKKINNDEETYRKLIQSFIIC